VPLPGGVFREWLAPEAPKGSAGANGLRKIARVSGCFFAATLGSVLQSRRFMQATRGTGAAGFDEVRRELERNFTERGEIGAAAAVYWRGEKAVDLWGGRRTPDGQEPWNEDTLIIVNSGTKGRAAMTLAIANARGWLDYDAPVARAA
jgi:CubicO group peptidase (beta-lactamase class C family)